MSPISPYSAKAVRLLPKEEQSHKKRLIFVTGGNQRIQRELRRTPSGNPKLEFWLSLLIPKIFSYPLGKAKEVKKVIDFFTAAGKPNFSAIGTIPAESAKERNKIKNKYTKRAAVRPQIGGRLKPYGLSVQKDYDFLITQHIGFNSRAPNRSAWRIA